MVSSNAKQALFEAIGREDLLERLASGDVVLVDVRPEVEFAAGHIEGARSIPLAELERRLARMAAGTRQPATPLTGNELKGG